MTTDNKELDELRVNLLSDFLYFVRFFFELQHGKEFIISKPISSQSHFITISDCLTDVFKGKINRLAINCPPGWSKSVLCKYFVAWATAWYPDSNHMYISFSHELAASHTYDIKQIINSSQYKNIFGISIKNDSRAKDFFKTSFNGEITAFGSAGSITGRNAGLPGQDRYSGALIIDDLLKPDDAHSDLKREKIKRNYYETIETRLRGENVPIIAIGQRLHEDDIFAEFFSGKDGHNWNKIIIKAKDIHGNSMYPEVMSNQLIKIKENTEKYVFSSQFMQEPIPSGGALYQKDDFLMFNEDPEIIESFLTCDTAETSQTFNDASVFSFWGIYKKKIKHLELPNEYALHWLDCREIFVEPKDLEDEFLDFWMSCMRYKIKPKVTYIEKKSSGVYLISNLKKVQGIPIKAIERTATSGSKSQRFIDIQPYIASKVVTFTQNHKHVKMCIDHMVKITANNSHKRDDIADTCYDAIKQAIIDKTVVTRADNYDYNNVAKIMNSNFAAVRNVKNSSRGISGF